MGNQSSTPEVDRVLDRTACGVDETGHADADDAVEGVADPGAQLRHHAGRRGHDVVATGGGASPGPRPAPRRRRSRRRRASWSRRCRARPWPSPPGHRSQPAFRRISSTAAIIGRELPRVQILARPRLGARPRPPPLDRRRRCPAAPRASRRPRVRRWASRTCTTSGPSGSAPPGRYDDSPGRGPTGPHRPRCWPGCRC